LFRDRRAVAARGRLHLVAELPGLGDFEDVLTAAKVGDEDALRLLFRAYQPRLLRFLRALEPAAADDLAGDVWLAVAGGLRGFSGDEIGFRGWLFAIARHRLADHRRRAARRPQLALPADQLAGRASADDPAGDAVEGLAAQAAIDRIVSALPGEQAEVVLLRVVAGLPVDEVAELTGRSAGSVRVIQHRALKRLARVFASKVVTL
jgi:RNA polymerase sigma-70 factor, ECF subfamily